MPSTSDRIFLTQWPEFANNDRILLKITGFAGYQINMLKNGPNQLEMVSFTGFSPHFVYSDCISNIMAGFSRISP